MDGPGPTAKFHTQRARRYEQVLTPHNTELPAHEQFMHRVQFDRREMKKRLFDTRVFTPGTQVMNELPFQLAKLTKENYFDRLDMYISPASREGEGEYKIFEHIANDTTAKKILVSGGDSDLMLYALQVPHVNVVVNVRVHEFLDAKILREEIHKCKPHCDVQSVVDDFCFLVLLNGNDYLSRMRGFLLSKTWKLYTQSKHSRLIQIEESNDNVTLKLNKEMFLEIVHIDKIAPATRVKQKMDMSRKVYITELVSKLYGNDEIEWDISQEEKLFRVKLNVKGTVVRAANLSLKTAYTLVEDEFMGTVLFQMLEKEFGITRSVYDAMVKPFYELSENGTKKQEQVARTPDEITKRHLEGILWVIQYLKIRCLSFSCQFTELAPNVEDFINTPTDAEGNIIVSLRQPYCESEVLLPQEFMMTILPVNAKAHVQPPALSKLMEIGSPVEDLYHGEFSDIQGRWKQQSSHKRLREAISASLGYNSLTRLQPTKRYTKNGKVEVETVKPHKQYDSIFAATLGFMKQKEVK